MHTANTLKNALKHSEYLELKVMSPVQNYKRGSTIVTIRPITGPQYEKSSETQHSEVNKRSVGIN